MKYFCFGYYDKDKFDGMTESDRNAMFDTCLEYDDHLRASGHWAGGEALQGPETALTLYWKNGKVATTDGPFAETKEQLGGILVLEALASVNAGLGTTTVIITHNAAIRKIAHRVLVFSDGRIAEVVENAERAKPSEVEW